MKTLLYILLTLSLSIPLTAYAAGGELYLSPESGINTVGKPFDVQVLANTGGQTVNAIEAELAYNPLDLEVVKISTDNSILTEWSTAPAYDSGAGTINFSGWAGSNYSGASGLLVTVRFRPLRTSQSALTFNSGAMLSAESRGSNIITSMKGAAFGSMPEQVAVPAPTIPDTSTTSGATIQNAQTIPEDSGASQGAALPLAGTSTGEAAALAYAGMYFASYYLPFFGMLAFIAFLIAYYFHRKKIAF